MRLPRRARIAWGLPFAALLAAAWLAPAAPAPAPAPVAAGKPAGPTNYERVLKPFLAKHCFNCHNSDKEAGGLALDVFTSEAHARKDRKTWGMVIASLQNGDMPPKSKPQPTTIEKTQALNYLERELTAVDCVAPKDPGRVTLRRLNRAEYNNTVRDLCGVDFQPADDFPSDDVGYGFDNIGDVLSIQPLLMEKYLAAAEQVVDRVFDDAKPMKSHKESFRPQNILATPRKAKPRGEEDPKVITFQFPGEAFLDKYHISRYGEYLLKVRAYGRAADGQNPKVTLRFAGKDLATLDVKPADKALDKNESYYEAKFVAGPGDYKIAAAFGNPPKDGTPADQARTLIVDRLEVEGPIREMPDPKKPVIFTASYNPAQPASVAPAARKILTNFARRAYRRPVKQAEIDRLMKLFEVASKSGDKPEYALRLPMKAVLTSPHFLYKVEQDARDPQATKSITDHELAVRLSYFLWSTMPDDELSRLADSGSLRKPGVMPAQIARMLKDEKAEALAENFAGQWLMLRSVQSVQPDTTRFKNFDESLRRAMVRESELFFDHVARSDRPITDFLDSDYTFVNDRLSWHYGIPNVQGPQFRMVKHTDKNRGGILTQAAILTVTSNPERTSPVKRGKWVYENILGLTAPPAAPDVGELPPADKITGTLREVFEKHRSNPACASCHSKLDPLGFGLENFDAVGAYRWQENKKNIDSSGVLPDGSKFSGAAEMKKVLLGKADMFRRCLAEKLLTYATGRGLEYYDKCALDDVVKKVKAGGDKFSALVAAVVETEAFQKRKSQRSE